MQNLENDTDVLFLVAYNPSLDVLSISCHLVQKNKNGRILESYPIASKILSASKSDLENLKRLNNKLEEEVKTLPLLFCEEFYKACEDLVNNFED